MAFITNVLPTSVCQTSVQSQRLTLKSSHSLCKHQSAFHSRASRRSFLNTLAFSAASFALPSLTMSAEAPEINDLKVGDGAQPKKGETLYVHYTLTLGAFEEAGGKMVDSSRSRNALFS